MKFRRQPGIALPFVLLIIVLMLVTVSTVTKQGLGSLQQAKVEQFSKQALFVAEAGASDALRNLVEDPTFTGPIPQTTMPLGGVYSVELINNITPGAGTLTAPNGAQVPEGFVYILATGRFASVTRRTGLLVSPGSSTAFGIGIGAGGTIRMSGNKDVRGTLKANGEIRLSGNSSIIPLDGSGRVLSSGNIRFSGNTRIDDSQDVRARGNLQTSGNTNGGILMQGSDTSQATLPFITDYRITNSLSAGEQGLVMPNPDQTVLLDPTNPNFVDHGTITTMSSLALNDQIHYFPNGVTFPGNTNFTGRGTIVVDNGNSIRFSGNQNPINANLIALRSPSQFPSTGSPSIIFSGNSTVNGLVYAHEDVRFGGNATVNGVVIAYRDAGGDIRTSGNTNITLDSTVFSNIPGFESWAGGFGGVGGLPAGAGPISVVIWERM